LTTASHVPNMKTMIMVEKAIKESEEPMTKYSLWRKLPKGVEYPTLQWTLEYLEAHNSILIDKSGRVVWIAADNAKLKELLKTGVELK
jgi:hypothetical protein